MTELVLWVALAAGVYAAGVVALVAGVLAAVVVVTLAPPQEPVLGSPS